MVRVCPFIIQLVGVWPRTLIVLAFPHESFGLPEKIFVNGLFLRSHPIESSHHQRCLHVLFLLYAFLFACLLAGLYLKGFFIFAILGRCNMVFELVDVVLADSWALGGEVLNFVEIVLPVFGSVSINFTICCLWAREVGSRPWDFFLLLTNDVGECGSGAFVHFSGERASLSLWAIGVGGRDGLFDSEEVIEVGEFIFRLGVG